MKKIKLQPREKLIVSVAVLAVVGYLFYSFWYQPYSDKIGTIQNQISSMQSQISKDQSLLSRQKTIDAGSGDIEIKARALQNQLPSVDAAPSVLQDMQSIISKSGAVVNNMALNTSTSPVVGSAPKAVNPALDVRSVQVNISGTYAQIYATVRSIEANTARTYTVSDLMLTGDKGKLSGSMTVQMYFDKNPMPGFTYRPMLVSKGKADPFGQ